MKPKTKLNIMNCIVNELKCTNQLENFTYHNDCDDMCFIIRPFPFRNDA